LDKAEQCLKEAVALDQKMIPALLLYGMLNCIGERYEEGSEFMELATTSDPNNIATWAIRGLFYEQQGNRVMEEMCYEEAVRLSRGQSEKTFLTSYRMQGPAGVGEEGGKTPSKPGKGESEDLLKPDTLIKEDSTTMTSSDEPAEPQAPIVMVDNSDDPNASKVEVQPGVPPTTEPVPPCGEGEVGGREDPRANVFLQTASFLLDVHALKYAEMSLSHVLASPSPPPSLYHIQEARLHLHKAQPREALTCLKASLQLDVQNSWAWSLLGHAHFLLGEFPLARAAYERTLLLQTPPPNLHSVFLHLAHIHLSDKKYSSARDVYLRACRNTPSGATWRGVGVACYKLGDLSEAEAALCEANVLNNHDPLIWAYLTLVCLKTGRPVEAEQALKFAVKTGLRTELGVVQEIRQEMMSHQQDPAHQHIPHLLTQLI
jgi:tetratricopeptide (TPR) repeat protein